jgi:hypothetical protein
MIFPLNEIYKHQTILNNHPLLNNYIIKNLTDLRLFMEHHVFAVWDFMSLVKSLQNHLCPSSNCWVPSNKTRSMTRSARLINEIVLAEETDFDLNGISIISHFELYCNAMHEIGAEVITIEKWLKSIIDGQLPNNFSTGEIPEASEKFVQKTFEFISTGKPHIIAAAFAFGREKIIPEMFIRLVTQLNLTQITCPKLFYYLNRHIEVDGEEHGPASTALVEDLCDNNSIFIKEAEKAAIKAIKSRIVLWDNVASVIQNNKPYA